MLLDDACEKVCLKEDSSISGIYISKDRYKAEQLIERIISQTEEDRALFYLPPYGDAGIAVHSIANLRVHVPVTVDYYDTLVGNLKGRLGNEYQNRLGWLVGNLFSRVAIPDIGQEEKETIIKEFLARKDKEYGPYWISRDAITEAQRKKLEMNGKTTKEIFELLESLTPGPPKERAIDRVLSILKEETRALSEPDLEKVSRRLHQDSIFARSIRKPE
jgi:hypothetical protein